MPDNGAYHYAAPHLPSPGSPPCCNARFAAHAKSHQLDRDIFALGPTTSLTASTSILPQQRKSAGCIAYSYAQFPTIRATGCRSGYSSGQRRPRQLNEDFRDLVVALHDAGARFIVVGAHAMAVHGVPRATGDLNVWIESTEANADRAWRALCELGARIEPLGVSREDLLRPGTVIQLGLPTGASTC